MRTSEKAWLGLGIGVAAYEVVAPKDELLSEQVDRWLESDNKFIRYGTPLVIGMIALHLANLINENIDPLHLLAKISRQ